MAVYRSQAVIQKNSVMKFIRALSAATTNQQKLTGLLEHKRHEREQSGLFDHRSAFIWEINRIWQKVTELTLIPKLLKAMNWMVQRGRKSRTNLFPPLPSGLHWASTPNQDEVHTLRIKNCNYPQEKKLEPTHLRWPSCRKSHRTHGKTGYCHGYLQRESYMIRQAQDKKWKSK